MPCLALSAALLRTLEAVFSSSTGIHADKKRPKFLVHRSLPGTAGASKKRPCAPCRRDVVTIGLLYYNEPELLSNVISQWSSVRYHTTAIATAVITAAAIDRNTATPTTQNDTRLLAPVRSI